MIGRACLPLLLCAAAAACGSDPAPSLCGNHTLDEGEDCDGEDLAEQTCVTLGFVGGVLECHDTCAYDTTFCSSTTQCGDGVIEGNEVCEGSDLGGQTCEGLGYGGGVLRCATGCLHYDTSQCHECGDGFAQGDELCDGDDLDGATCVALGYAGGFLYCNLTCDGYQTAYCVAPGCGNDIAEPPGEVCDGVDLEGLDCVDLGFAGGTLACQPTCDAYDTQGCTGSP